LSRVTRAGGFRPVQILSADESASHPVITRVGDAVLVAWTSRSSSGKATDPAQIRIARVRVSDI
jgi:hypothetical protein